jgi:hypothetical protein
VLWPLGSRRRQKLGGSGFSFHEVAFSEGGDVWDICFRLQLEPAGKFVPSIKVPLSGYTRRLLGNHPGPLQLSQRENNYAISPAPLAVANYFSAAEFKENFDSAAPKGRPRCFVFGLFFNGKEIPNWKMTSPKERLFPTRSATASLSKPTVEDQ